MTGVIVAWRCRSAHHDTVRHLVGALPDDASPRFVLVSRLGQYLIRWQLALHDAPKATLVVLPSVSYLSESASTVRRLISSGQVATISIELTNPSQATSDTVIIHLRPSTSRILLQHLSAGMRFPVPIDLVLSDPSERFIEDVVTSARRYNTAAQPYRRISIQVTRTSLSYPGAMSGAPR